MTAHGFQALDGTFFEELLRRERLNPERVPGAPMADKKELFHCSEVRGKSERVVAPDASGSFIALASTGAAAGSSAVPFEAEAVIVSSLAAGADSSGFAVCDELTAAGDESFRSDDPFRKLTTATDTNAMEAIAMRTATELLDRRDDRG